MFLYDKASRLIEWIADGFSSLAMTQQEAAKDAKQKAALSPEDSEESPMVLQVSFSKVNRLY